MDHIECYTLQSVCSVSLQVFIGRHDFRDATDVDGISSEYCTHKYIGLTVYGHVCPGLYVIFVTAAPLCKYTIALVALHIFIGSNK